MATLPQAIDEIQADIRTISGIRAAPAEPTEALNVFPFVVAFAGTGNWKQSPAGSKTGLHTIKLELHVARKDLPRDVQAAMTYSDSIPNKLFSGHNTDRFNNTVDALNEIRYTFGPMAWGGVDTLGFRFEIDVKMQSVVS